MGSSGLLGHNPPISLHSPVPKGCFGFVWLHCTSGTWTCTNKSRAAHGCEAYVHLAHNRPAAYRRKDTFGILSQPPHQHVSSAWGVGLQHELWTNQATFPWDAPSCFLQCPHHPKHPMSSSACQYVINFHRLEGKWGLKVLLKKKKKEIHKAMLTSDLGK